MYFVKCSEPVSKKFWKTGSDCDKMLFLCVYMSTFQLNKGYFATSHGQNLQSQLSQSYPLAYLLLNLYFVQANMNFIFAAFDCI